MVERRSLKTALQLSPEKMAFVQGAPPEVRNSSALVSAEATALDTTGATSNEPQPNAVRTTPRVKRMRNARHARAQIPESDERLLGIANLLVPLTTRLHPSTAVALKRASLEQRLRGDRPASVQEIAEEAIQAWLRDSGYLG